jgi:hypothetical protein
LAYTLRSIQLRSMAPHFLTSPLSSSSMTFAIACPFRVAVTSPRAIQYRASFIGLLAYPWLHPQRASNDNSKICHWQGSREWWMEPASDRLHPRTFNICSISCFYSPSFS